MITGLFQDTELLVSIFPFLVDACKDLLFCKYVSQQCRAGGSRGQCCSSGCLEIPILCLCPAFGVGVIRKVDGSWKVNKGPEPMGRCGAMVTPRMLMHQLLGFFKE